MKRFLDYNQKLKDRAKELRKNMTEPEKKLWYLYLREISNTKFRVYKQRPIDNFIVDFYIPKIKLVIEIDGDNHYTENALVYDEERSQILKGLGLNVLRYTNDEIMHNLNGVMKDLKKNFEKIDGMI